MSGALESASVECMVRDCHRYTIREYPEALRVEATIRSTLAAGHTEAWSCAVVAMEVLPFRLTGVAASSADGITIELAEGHFVPKGIVGTSTFLVAPDGAVSMLSQSAQDYALRIVDGHVVEERPTEALPYDHTLIATIADQLRPLLDITEGGVEFGIMMESGEALAYVIDAADGGADIIPSSDQMLQGVISPGITEGTVRRVRLGATDESLNTHIFDEDRTDRIQGTRSGSRPAGSGTARVRARNGSIMRIRV